MSLIFKFIKFFLPLSIIQTLKIKYNVPDMEWSLKNLQNNGFKPRTILDIGAYEGEWTKMCQSIFKESHFFMFEAQESKKILLEKIKSNKIDFHIGLLGPKSQVKSKFYVNETVSSALAESAKSDQEFVEIPMYTVDELVQLKSIENIDFIKLDVQGFELEVLKGAHNTLVNVEVVLMEVSLIEINKGAPLINEVISFMYNFDFVCYDICSIIRRPLDNALWQTDLIFIKSNSKLIASKKYQ